MSCAFADGSKFSFSLSFSFSFLRQRSHKASPLLSAAHYTIVVANITSPIAQHIHSGVVGVNGPIVISFPGTWVGNTLVGVTATDQATRDQIVPGGAVRGQLAAEALASPTMSTTGLLALLGILAVAGIVVLRRM